MYIEWKNRQESELDQQRGINARRRSEYDEHAERRDILDLIQHPAYQAQPSEVIRRFAQRPGRGQKRGRHPRDPDGADHHASLDWNLWGNFDASERWIRVSGTKTKNMRRLWAIRGTKEGTSQCVGFSETKWMSLAKTNWLEWSPKMRRK